MLPHAAKMAARVAGDHDGRNISIVDLLPEDMLPMIHEHWYKFPPMETSMHYILGMLIIVIGIISVSGNGVVMYLMMTVKNLRTPGNFLVLNLALSDFGMLFFMMPTMSINCFAETWVIGPFMCELYGMIGSLFGSASIWSLVMITLDRYNVIVKGMAGKPLTKVGALLRMLFVWIWSLGWTIAPMYGWSRYVPEGSMTSCTIDYIDTAINPMSYLIAYAIFVYFVPLFIIIYCYAFIVMQVAAHEKSLREQAKKMNIKSLRSNEDNKKASAEFRLAKVAFMTICCWFMAWTPYLTLSFLGIFSDRTWLTPMTSVWGAIFAKASACYNPIVYGISHPKYRAALHDKFPCLKCGSDSPKGDSASTVAESEKAGE
ncbi:lateral eye opsin-like [Ailuropoda melanoleuca]|uniref:Kumopsin1 n=2 Tax=Hasarius adansoni TaxID=243517 RepID=B1B1U5_9ARAC|nr:lateral eye opsin-like [Ailuropoda melanoleuca]BAG14330.1 kumopsin1 [Hasarius adansoni]